MYFCIYLCVYLLYSVHMDVANLFPSFPFLMSIA